MCILKFDYLHLSLYILAVINFINNSSLAIEYALCISLTLSTLNVWPVKQNLVQFWLVYWGFNFSYS